VLLVLVSQVHAERSLAIKPSKPLVGHKIELSYDLEEGDETSCEFLMRSPDGRQEILPCDDATWRLDQAGIWSFQLPAYFIDEEGLDATEQVRLDVMVPHPTLTLAQAPEAAQVGDTVVLTPKVNHLPRWMDRHYTWHIQSPDGTVIQGEGEDTWALALHQPGTWTGHVSARVGDAGHRVEAEIHVDVPLPSAAPAAEPEPQPDPDAPDAPAP
jgi:hypothetical protein